MTNKVEQPAVDADVAWLLQHLENDAEACSAVNGSRDGTTVEARRAEVTVKRVVRERQEARDALKKCLDWMESLRAHRDGGLLDWDAQEVYIRGLAVLKRREG